MTHTVYGRGGLVNRDWVNRGNLVCPWTSAHNSFISHEQCVKIETLNVKIEPNNTQRKPTAPSIQWFAKHTARQLSKTWGAPAHAHPSVHCSDFTTPFCKASPQSQQSWSDIIHATQIKKRWDPFRKLCHSPNSQNHFTKTNSQNGRGNARTLSPRMRETHMLF